MKKILAVVMTGILCFNLVACSNKTEGSATKDDVKAKTTVELIKEKGEIIVGTSADYPPYEYHKMVDGKDTIVGSDIKLAELIGEKLGVKVVLKDMAFDGLLLSLSEGQYDMVIAGLSIDPKRQVLFSDSYCSRGQVVVIKKANADKYKVVTDLDGKKVGGQKGTVQEELAGKIAKTTPIALVKFPDLITEVKNGTLDAMLADSDVAQGYVLNNDDLVISDIKIDYENSNVGIAFKQDNVALRDEINKILAELKKDGTLDKIKKDSIAESAEAQK
ncbi:MAG: transporter substrate-binding domain-containing protein [Filifactoraceae bacterium]